MRQNLGKALHDMFQPVPRVEPLNCLERLGNGGRSRIVKNDRDDRSASIEERAKFIADPLGLRRIPAREIENRAGALQTSLQCLLPAGTGLDFIHVAPYIKTARTHRLDELTGSLLVLPRVAQEGVALRFGGHLENVRQGA